MCERTQLTLSFPPQTPTLPPGQVPLSLLLSFDYWRQVLWPLWSEEHPGEKITLTKSLPSCQSNIIEDCAKNTESWAKCPLFQNLSGHCPRFLIKGIPRKWTLQRDTAPSTNPPSYKKESLKLTRTELSKVWFVDWYRLSTGYHDRISTESERKPLKTCIAISHCQDIKGHCFIFYKLSVYDGLDYFNGSLPQTVWEALHEREQCVIQCSLHPHKMLKMIPTGQNLDFCFLPSLLSTGS